MHNEAIRLNEDHRAELKDFFGVYTPLIDTESQAYPHEDADPDLLRALLEQYIIAYVTTWDTQPLREQATTTMRRRLNTLVSNPILTTKIAHSFGFLAQELATAWALRHSEEPYTPRRYADMVRSWQSVEKPEEAQEREKPQPTENPNDEVPEADALASPQLPHETLVNAYIQKQLASLMAQEKLTTSEHTKASEFMHAWITWYTHLRLKKDPQQDGWQELTQARTALKDKLALLHIPANHIPIIEKKLVDTAFYIAHVLKRDAPALLVHIAQGNTIEDAVSYQKHTIQDIIEIKKRAMETARRWYLKKVAGIENPTEDDPNIKDIAKKYTLFRNIGGSLMHNAIPIASAYGVGAATVALGGVPHVISAMLGGGVGYTLSRQADTHLAPNGAEIGALEALQARTAVSKLAEGIGEMPGETKFEKFIYDTVIKKMYESPHRKIGYSQIASEARVIALLERYSKDAERTQKNTRWLLLAGSLVGLVYAHARMPVVSDESRHFAMPKSAPIGERLQDMWSQFWNMNLNTPQHMCDTTCFNKPFGSPGSWPPPVHGGGATLAAGHFGWGK